MRVVNGDKDEAPAVRGQERVRASGAEEDSEEEEEAKEEGENKEDARTSGVVPRDDTVDTIPTGADIDVTPASGWLVKDRRERTSVRPTSSTGAGDGNRGVVVENRGPVPAREEEDPTSVGGTNVRGGRKVKADE